MSSTSIIILKVLLRWTDIIPVISQIWKGHWHFYCESSMVSKKQGMVPHHARIGLGVRVMVFNATFNNILVILLQSVSLMKETGENHQPAVSHWQTLSHNVVSSTPHLNGIQIHVSGDRHWLHRWLKIQLPYDYDHDGLGGKLLSIQSNLY